VLLTRSKAIDDIGGRFDRGSGFKGDDVAVVPGVRLVVEF